MFVIDKTDLFVKNQVNKCKFKTSKIRLFSILLKHFGLKSSFLKISHLLIYIYNFTVFFLDFKSLFKIFVIVLLLLNKNKLSITKINKSIPSICFKSVKGNQRLLVTFFKCLPSCLNISLILFQVIFIRKV